jgi:hypothetical protein
VAVAVGAVNERDGGLLIAARQLGEEIVATTSRKILRQMLKQMRAIGTTCVVEGLRASDGSRVTEEDYAFFNWAAGHAIAEAADWAGIAKTSH